jgi:putative serine protease PepD
VTDGSGGTGTNSGTNSTTRNATGGNTTDANGTGGYSTDTNSTGVTGPEAWWSDAANDPWRDPGSDAVIVSGRAGSPAPPPEPESDVLPHQRHRGTGFVAIVAVVSGLLAGALGGSIGYVAATANGAPTVVVGSGSKGQPPAPARAPGSLPALITRVMPSVVTVQGTVAQGESIGSGFVITSEGHILTNEHVISEVADNAVRVTLSDGTVIPARVVGRDPESDLAVLKVARTGLPPVQFADSNAVAVGDSVVAIGAPLALSGTVTAGIVSALDRTIETRDVGGVQRYYAAIQTDAAVNRGNSGGPLFDYAGRVVGINSVIKSLVDQGADAGNIGIAFAIPINQAARVATELIDTGHAKRTVIGAELDQAPGAASGVRLSRVDAGGPAAAAGLQTGDVVIRIGSHPVDQPPDLIALVRRYDPGTVVTLVYRRGTATQTASVTLVADAN